MEFDQFERDFGQLRALFRTRISH